MVHGLCALLLLAALPFGVATAQAQSQASLLLGEVELPVWSLQELCAALREPRACIVAGLDKDIATDARVREAAKLLATEAGSRWKVVAVHSRKRSWESCSGGVRSTLHGALSLSSGLFVAASGPQDRSCLLVSSPPEVHVQPLLTGDPVAQVSDHCELDVETPLAALRCRLRAGAYKPTAPEVCEAVPAESLTPDTFLRRFVSRSRPVVIRGAAAAWPAMARWLEWGYLEQKAGHRRVSFKAAPGGRFEGTEPLALWDPLGQQQPPAEVLQQLESPELVVVRPQALEDSFASFLTRVRANASHAGAAWPSFYMEYMAMKGNVDELEGDLRLPAFASFLHAHSTNLWLGDGQTVGKLHFDPFENLLGMVAGTKRFTLYHPWRNEDLYEGHIREAQLEFNERTGTFRRTALPDSTAMVMSPVDISAPDLDRYPLFERAVPVTCEVGRGDMLYVPAFHWHEVQSSPEDGRDAGALASLNVAANMWFRPFFEKEFPCRECRPSLNWRDYPTAVRQLQGEEAALSCGGELQGQA